MKPKFETVELLSPTGEVVELKVVKRGLAQARPSLGPARAQARARARAQAQVRARGVPSQGLQCTRLTQTRFRAKQIKR
jgi:hypothetical protein